MSAARRAASFLLYWLCWLLDHVPSVERDGRDGRLHIYWTSGFGCRLGVSQVAFRLERT